MKFVPHLHFNRNCREAQEFYLEVFQGLLVESISYKEGLVEVEEDENDLVMYSAISLKNDILYLSDDRKGEDYLPNTTIVIECDSREELHNIGEKLGNDGEIIKSLNETAWGSYYTVIKDKFGIFWGLNYEKSLE